VNWATLLTLICPSIRTNPAPSRRSTRTGRIPFDNKNTYVNNANVFNVVEIRRPQVRRSRQENQTGVRPPILRFCTASHRLRFLISDANNTSTLVKAFAFKPQPGDAKSLRSIGVDGGVSDTQHARRMACRASAEVTGGLYHRCLFLQKLAG